MIGISVLIASAVVSVGAQIAAAEGEKLVAYQDVGGVWTICHEHTGPECAGASARVMRGVELGTGSI